SSFSVSASASPAPASSPRPTSSSAFTAPRPAPSPPASPATPETSAGAPPAVDPGSNGSAPAVPDASFASAAGSILSAPVPGDGFNATSGIPAEVTTPAYEMPETEPAHRESSKSLSQPERVAVTSDAGDSSSYKTFDVASTLRRPVVFEEDDDLDVPDF